LGIELLDELVFGVREAAWPLIRHDLHLAYIAIGLLLALPKVGAVVIEPVLGLLADAGYRRLLIIGGGIIFGSALVMTGLAWSFGVLLLAFVMLYAASGSFVSLSQATLMDLDPGRREANMARWVLAGSFGVVLGPLLLTASLVAGYGWRPIFVSLSLLSAALVLAASGQPTGRNRSTSLVAGFKAALAALASGKVQQTLLMLEAGDLMGDVLTGYLALYFVDVAGVSSVDAGLAVLTLTVASLAGNAVLLPVLRRISGMDYLQASSLAVAAVYPAFLLTPGFAPKLIPLALLGALRAGWYAVPQARLYALVPEASGSILLVSNAGALLSACIPLGFGFGAQRLGFGATMWFLMLGPLTMLFLSRMATDEAAPAGPPQPTGSSGS
jgi:MFS transporter, FSR family, fosmidomycin resistance protein